MKFSSILLIMLLSAGSVSGTSVRYEPLFDGAGGFSVDVQRKTINLGDLILNLNFCSLRDEFACIEGAGQDFAFPRHFAETKQGSVWVRNGYSYEVQDVFETELFGRCGTFYIVDRVEQSLDMAAVKRHVFSVDHGLIATAVIDSQYQLAVENPLFGPKFANVLVISSEKGLLAFE